jgi:hypothetical protein
MKLSFSTNAPQEDLFEQLDGRFNLIVIGQPAPDVPIALRGLMKVQEIPGDGANGAVLARERIPAVSFFLLRPDGHIGLAGIRAEKAALQQYWSERLAGGVR